MGSTDVKLPDGSHVNVTAANYQDVTSQIIAANPQFDRSQKIGVIEALRQLVGLGNGDYTVNASGAAAPETSANSVLTQPFVALADLIAPSGSGLRTFFQRSDVQAISAGGVGGLQTTANAGEAVGLGFSDAYDQTVAQTQKAIKAVILGFGDAVDAVKPNLPNPNTLVYTVIALGAGLGALFIYVRFSK